jgi:hypothetical protein
VNSWPSLMQLCSVSSKRQISTRSNIVALGGRWCAAFHTRCTLTSNQAWQQSSPSFISTSNPSAGIRGAKNSRRTMRSNRPLAPPAEIAAAIRLSPQAAAERCR